MSLGVGVFVGVGVKVWVNVGVLVGVGVKVWVNVGVLVGVGVKVWVNVGVLVEVGVGVGVGGNNGLKTSTYNKSLSPIVWVKLYVYVIGSNPVNPLINIPFS